MAAANKAFDMGRMAIGGIGQVLDSMELVKRAWSTLNVPSTLVPTVDIEELDKRIADLKAVEQWLNVNLSMLRGTIQGMEIQRGTLAAVKAFGATLGTLAPQPGAAGTPPEPPMPASRRAAEPAAAPPAAQAPQPPAPEPAAAAPRSAARKAKARAGNADAAPPIPPTLLPGIDPSAWWNLLQQNFNQVAEAALSGVGLQGAAARGATAPATPADDAAPAAGTRRTAGAGAAKKRAPPKRTRMPKAAG